MKDFERIKTEFEAVKNRVNEEKERYLQKIQEGEEEAELARADEARAVEADNMKAYTDAKTRLEFAEKKIRLNKDNLQKLGKAAVTQSEAAAFENDVAATIDALEREAEKRILAGVESFANEIRAFIDEIDGLNAIMGEYQATIAHDFAEMTINGKGTGLMMGDRRRLALLSRNYINAITKHHLLQQITAQTAENE